ncbi:hypothetical protein [Flavobacterium magnum]|uniref:hypothetical protein n=1 Tax=Flavobacterium magnum TaxID=2162713 RepID=UPI0015E6715F|nr:hypothetical protein [Flavobacterium magnum]
MYGFFFAIGGPSACKLKWESCKAPHSKCPNFGKNHSHEKKDKKSAETQPEKKPARRQKLARQQHQRAPQEGYFEKQTEIRDFEKIVRCDAGKLEEKEVS